jgi:hypothetical protein
VNTNSQIVKKQAVTQFELSKSNNVEINGINNGIYFVKIQSVKFSKTIKLIVQ